MPRKAGVRRRLRKIEVFHKILKSGCRAEDAKLRTADRLANLVALFCIVSWRVLWMTMAARADPEASPTVAFTASEIIILDQLVAKPATGTQSQPPSSSISSSWRVSVVTSPERPTRHQVTQSYGEASDASPTSRSALSSADVGNRKARRTVTVELDSNTVERSIRPLALNRKNALFAGSDEGGDNWAVIATLIENCKISGVNPHTWLAQTLAKLASSLPANAVGELMPWIAVA